MGNTDIHEEITGAHKAKGKEMKKYKTSDRDFRGEITGTCNLSYSSKRRKKTENGNRKTCNGGAELGKMLFVTDVQYLKTLSI